MRQWRSYSMAKNERNVATSKRKLTSKSRADSMLATYTGKSGT